jgi:hypothetical protein
VTRAGLLVGLALFFSLPALAAVDVASRATAGTGTVTDPWTGWDTNTSWAADTEYFFRTGNFAYASSPNFLQAGLALIGEAGATLRFRGAGDALVFDSDGQVGNVRIENLIVQGNAKTANGIFMRGARDATLRHVSVRDVAGAALRIQDSVGGSLENVRVTHFEMADARFLVAPRYGIVLSSGTTGFKVMNAVVEGATAIGIWIQARASGNTFLSGTSEGNRGKGIVIDGDANTIVNTDFEENAEGQDIEISGSGNELRAVYASHFVNVLSGQANRIRGRFHRITIAEQCTFTDISGSYMSGSLVDFSETTVKYGYQTSEGFQRGGHPGRGP